MGPDGADLSCPGSSVEQIKTLGMHKPTNGTRVQIPKEDNNESDNRREE